MREERNPIIDNFNRWFDSQEDKPPEGVKYYMMVAYIQGCDDTRKEYKRIINE